MCVASLWGGTGPVRLVLPGGGWRAAAAGFERVDWGEGGAADLVVAAQDQVGHDGGLAAGLAAPGGHQQRDSVEELGSVRGVAVGEEGDDHGGVDRHAQRPGEVGRRRSPRGAQRDHRDARARPGFRRGRRGIQRPGSRRPGAEHLTLALIGMSDGTVPPILSALGISQPTLRSAIYDRYRQAS